MTHN